MNNEYQKAIRLIAELLTLDADTKQKISTHIQSYGIEHFLQNLEAFNLSQEAMQKLQNLKIVLDRYADYKQEQDSADNGGDV